MTNTTFPQAINDGFEGEPILFLSQEREGNVLMRADNHTITRVDNYNLSEKNELPIYIKLMSTFIFSGKTALAG